MSELQIAEIRRKFILFATLSYFIVMLFMGGLIYLFTAVTVRNEVRQIMAYIIAGDGKLEIPPKDTQKEEEADTRGDSQTAAKTESAGQTSKDPQDEDQADGETQDEDSYTIRQEMVWSLYDLFGVTDMFINTSDFSYSTRYFAVLFDEEGNLSNIRVRHISDVDRSAAEFYARVAMRRMIKFGSLGRYYYQVSERPNGGTIVVYLDRSQQIFNNYRVLFAALILMGVGTIIVFLLVRLFSNRIVETEKENAERQKQFVTNASHELKTPLAVIRANTEMQEMLGEENEWTQSTLRQVARMEGLIQNLVLISRSREKEGAVLQKMNISPAVEETANAFQPVAMSENKSLTKDIQEDVVLTTEESKIRQLLSILLDNAVKYCDDEGTINVKLVHQGKFILMSVANDYASGSNEECRRYFERFYRRDTAHNEKGGYGIGLSVAESLINQIGGSISASWKEGVITFTCRFRGEKQSVSRNEPVK